MCVFQKSGQFWVRTLSTQVRACNADQIRKIPKAMSGVLDSPTSQARGRLKSLCRNFRGMLLPGHPAFFRVATPMNKGLCSLFRTGTPIHKGFRAAVLELERPCTKDFTTAVSELKRPCAKAFMKNVGCPAPTVDIGHTIWYTIV